jgi:pimeloyl-ACP methyl ester carboxylesterase
MKSRESVVLVNGLWLNNVALWLMATRLRGAGFAVFSFSYSSVRRDLRANAEHLQQFLARVPGETVHLVGYSLGGVVIRALFHYFPRQRPGRIVLLGSPQAGNRSAVAVRRRAPGRWITGRSVAELVTGTPDSWSWPAREIGVVAGNRSLGLGRLFAVLPGPNDGTVCVDETRVAGARDQLTMPVAHSAMLLSPLVARQTAAFLRRGEFER